MLATAACASQEHLKQGEQRADNGLTRECAQHFRYLLCLVAVGYPPRGRQAIEIYFRTSAWTNALALLGPVTRTVMR